MTARMNPYKAAPDAMKAMSALEAYVQGSGLDHSLIHLVKIRASQINGCAYCVHMHTQEARRDGEAEERLHLLATWWESSYFTPRERAALRWTEALTQLPETRAPDDAWEELKAQFSEEDMAKLTLAISTINVWNRIAVGFRFAHPDNWDGRPRG